MLSLRDPTRVLKNLLGTSPKISSTTGCSMNQKNSKLNWMHCWMRVRSSWGATCLAQKKSERAMTGRAGGERNVAIAGGAHTVNQYLSAGLIDELWLHIVPVIIGSGARLFESVPDIKLEPFEISGTKLVTHIRYRVIKQ